MLRSLLPKSHQTFLSMPVLGRVADGFDDWLAITGYTPRSRKQSVRMLRLMDAHLQRRHVYEVVDLTSQILNDCRRVLLKVRPNRVGTVRTLQRYLVANGLLASSQPATACSSVGLIEEYAKYLLEVRGFARSTILNHRRTALNFLRYLNGEGIGLEDIQGKHLESFITKAGQRVGPLTVRQDIGALRAFLRYLTTDGQAQEGLAGEIDAPRLYRSQRLPRALPWETVRALLRGVDRTTPVGLRNYAAFLLIATYGLRVSDVASITLDDIHWRQGRLRIQQTKTSAHLELPLTNEVSSAVMEHLRRTPPPSGYRSIFMKMRAPIGALTPRAIDAAFRSLVFDSGLNLSFRSPHCLRHSLAVQLLKSGTTLKTIGDILGHRSVASTSTYLRLATEDLRDVSLPVPGMPRQAKGEQR